MGGRVFTDDVINYRIAFLMKIRVRTSTRRHVGSALNRPAAPRVIRRSVSGVAPRERRFPHPGSFR
jgi:hypothetical protein